MVDLIEMGAVHPQDIVKNLRSAIAQSKPLSDEEIMAETVKAGLTAFKDTNIVLLEHATGELIEFARAIEERHGIK